MMLTLYFRLCVCKVLISKAYVHKEVMYNKLFSSLRIRHVENTYVHTQKTNKMKIEDGSKKKYLFA